MIRPLEIREYNFTGNVKVTVALNRTLGTMSIIDPDQIDPYAHPKGNHVAVREYYTQRWIFADRTVDYLNGWRNILKAIEYVIDDCEKTMKKWETEKTEAFTAMLIELDKIENKEEKPKNDKNSLKGLTDLPAVGLGKTAPLRRKK